MDNSDPKAVPLDDYHTSPSNSNSRDNGRGVDFNHDNSQINENQDSWGKQFPGRYKDNQDQQWQDYEDQQWHDNGMNGDPDKRSRVVCYSCHMPNHFPDKCMADESEFLGQVVICHECGYGNHASKDCRWVREQQRAKDQNNFASQAQGNFQPLSQNQPYNSPQMQPSSSLNAPQPLMQVQTWNPQQQWMAPGGDFEQFKQQIFGEMEKLNRKFDNGEGRKFNEEPSTSHNFSMHIETDDTDDIANTVHRVRRKVKANLCTMNVKINDKEFIALIDTGAQRTVASAKILEDLGIQTERCKAKIKGIGGGSIKIQVRTKLNLSIMGFDKEIVAFCTDPKNIFDVTPFDIVVGLDSLSKFGPLTHDVANWMFYMGDKSTPMEQIWQNISD